MNTHDRRLTALEAKRTNASAELGVLLLPSALSQDETRAWIAARTSPTATGPGVVIIPQKGEVR